MDILRLNDCESTQFTKVWLSIWENLAQMHNLRSLTDVLTPVGRVEMWTPEGKKNVLESLERINRR
jgi:hypothetical protein